LTELWRLSATALATQFANGTASPVEALESVLGRISDVDPSVSAFRCVQAERALADAAACTAELARGQRRGLLHGVPVAVKELFDVRGAPADYGSEALAGRVAVEDAELVRRLRRTGAVVVGTTRSHEFGWGITTQHRSRPGTCNPWNRERIPGGSSGGSAAAVAAGMVPVAVGSDTGGSIRIPACFCGVAGFKPTLGLISRSGGVPLAPSFDTPGAVARSIEDAAIVVSAMSGDDPGDPECDGRQYRYDGRIPVSLSGMRIGLSAALVDTPLDAGVERAYAGAVSALQELGAEVVEIDLPRAATMLEAFAPMQMAEAYHVHHDQLELFPARADDYGDDVRSRLEAAADVSVTDYLSAQEQRRRIVAAFDRQLRWVDAIVSPISAVGPSRIASSDTAVVNGELRKLRDVVMRFTVPQNLTGLPSAVVRAGFDDDGLPVGVQLTAARWQENVAVAVAAALQGSLGPIEIAPEPHHPVGR
jgi:aspartyl-tRNA(Asn)/glutamyl-tRNA(Gln) amidotransferase subunit A